MRAHYNGRFVNPQLCKKKKNMMKERFCLICILYKIVHFRETCPLFSAFSFLTHGAINTTNFSRISILKSQSIKKCTSCQNLIAFI